VRNTGDWMGIGMWMWQRLRCSASLALVAVVALIANLLLSQTVGATSICQWVDKNGKVQFSDVVPETYRSIVTCTHTPTTETPADQRAAGEKSKKRRDNSSPPATAASTVASPQSPASKPAAKQPVERVTDSTDCKTWRRLFDESGACFSPFRTARGGIKAEAFAACNEVPNPEAKCGPQTN
jgi:hypothetical protein